MGRCRTGTREVRFTTGWDSERESAPFGTQADRRRKAQLYAARGGRVQLSAPLPSLRGAARRVSKPAVGSGACGWSVDRSASPSPGGPTGRTGTAMRTSTKPPMAPSSATPGSCGAPRGSPRTRPASSVTSPAATCSRSAPGPASARAGCGPAAAVPLAWTSPTVSSSTRAGSTRRAASRVPSVLGTATAAAVRRRLLRRGVLVVRRAAVRQRARHRRGGGRPGAPARRPVRVLDHPPHPVDVPRRPHRGGAAGEPVLLGPDAVRRGRRRHRRGDRTSSTTAPSATGSSCSPAPASRSPAWWSRSGPRATTGSGEGGRRPAASTRPAPRSSPPTCCSPGD